MIQIEDVKMVAVQINKTLTDEQINEVLERYDFEQKQDDEATWDLVVEKIIYDLTL